MKKFIVETYYTCTFKTVHSLNDLNDKAVLKIFKKHFKNRKIIPIDCSVLVWGFGTIHCLTQQQPR